MNSAQDSARLVASLVDQIEHLKAELANATQAPAGTALPPVSSGLACDTFNVRSTTASGSGGGGAGAGAAVYECERAVHEYLQFHYAAESEMLPYEAKQVPGLPTSALNFTKRLAEECRAGISPGTKAGTKALDLGCAVGGASFELLRDFDYVKGIDYSHAFIAACNTLKADGAHPYNFTVQADVSQNSVAVVPEGISSSDRIRVNFEQGDACFLPKELADFDAVLCANLLCRLPRFSHKNSFTCCQKAG